MHLVGYFHSCITMHGFMNVKGKYYHIICLFVHCCCHLWCVFGEMIHSSFLMFWAKDKFYYAKIICQFVSVCLCLCFAHLQCGIAVRRSNPGVGRDLPHRSRQALGPTQPVYIGYRVFPGVGRDLPHWSRQALGPTQPVYIGYRVFLGAKKAVAWRWLTPPPL
jgi:hypothetical protein